MPHNCSDTPLGHAIRYILVYLGVLSSVSGRCSVPLADQIQSFGSHALSTTSLSAQHHNCAHTLLSLLLSRLLLEHVQLSLYLHSSSACVHFESYLIDTYHIRCTAGIHEVYLLVQCQHGQRITAVVHSTLHVTSRPQHHVPGPAITASCDW